LFSGSKPLFQRNHKLTDALFAPSTVFMMLAGGWGVAASDAALNNMILHKVPQYVPGLSGQTVLSVGAAGLQDVFGGAALRGVRQAYLDGLRAGWALGLAAFCVAIVCALVPKWPGRLVRPEPASGQEDEEEA
jgi:hypothetical protein